MGRWGGGVGTGKGTGKSMRKPCRNYPLAIYPLVSPLKAQKNPLCWRFLADFDFLRLACSIGIPAQDPSLVIFFSLTEAPLPDPTPTPPNTPETDPKRTRNRPETEPNGPETEPNGAEMDRNQAFRGGTGGGFVGVGGGVVREKENHYPSCII